MTSSIFGEMPDGRVVHLVTIGSVPGPVVELLTLGATVHRLEVKCGDGVRRNVVLGHPDVAERLASGDYIGGTVGRYANRIAAGRFFIGDRQVQVRTHDRGNSLHGGPEGFDVRLWDIVRQTADEVVLRMTSVDGDQGFPGEVTATVAYRVVDDAVMVTMVASTDATTVVNLTNHAYFNLDGEGAGTIDGHELQVEADHFTPVDSSGIPIGGHALVAGTPFDLREFRLLGPVLRSNHPQVVSAHGIDHNFVVRGVGMRRAALLTSRAGTTLDIWTDQPGVQVYTGNSLDGRRRSTSVGRYRQGDGIALEPQLFPDSPNRPDWPTAVLHPGEQYTSRIEWRFLSDRPSRASSAGS